MADSWLGEIGNEIERIFRYLLPGITILGFARLSHPSWFLWVRLENTQHIAILAALGLCIGCIWYPFHRYSIHQLIDWIFYRFEYKDFAGFPTWLSKHVVDSGRSKESDAAVRHNIGIRSSHIILLFIASEAGLLFSLANPEPSSPFAHYKCWIVVLSLIGVGVAVCQQWLTFRIDLYAVTTPATKKAT